MDSDRLVQDPVPGAGNLGKRYGCTSDLPFPHVSGVVQLHQDPPCDLDVEEVKPLVPHGELRFGFAGALSLDSPNVQPDDGVARPNDVQLGHVLGPDQEQEQDSPLRRQILERDGATTSGSPSFLAGIKKHCSARSDFRARRRRAACHIPGGASIRLGPLVSQAGSTGWQPLLTVLGLGSKGASRPSWSALWQGPPEAAVRPRAPASLVGKTCGAAANVHWMVRELPLQLGQVPVAELEAYLPSAHARASVIGDLSLPQGDAEIDLSIWLEAAEWNDSPSEEQIVVKIVSAAACCRLVDEEVHLAVAVTDLHHKRQALLLDLEEELLVPHGVQGVALSTGALLVER
mmetsp:Transcript_34862/g.82702  ORF Transcript_34862/g.82702 Transcript_34862/m.82702 type:complete len:346 (-) Transcript_34862:277-1314(-)